MNLTEPVECRTRRRPGHQQLTRGLRILRRLIPLAEPLHDFGAIEQALATITHEAGLSGTPLRERNGPLVGATQIEGLLTGFQHPAVDVARQDWRHVTCDHRDHRFVEQRDTFGDASEAMSARPRPLQASDARSRSPNRRAISAARVKVA